jgi:hypothetical protein
MRDRETALQGLARLIGPGIGETKWDFFLRYSAKPMLRRHHERKFIGADLSRVMRGGLAAEINLGDLEVQRSAVHCTEYGRHAMSHQLIC